MMTEPEGMLPELRLDRIGNRWIVRRVEDRVVVYQTSDKSAAAKVVAKREEHNEAVLEAATAPEAPKAPEGQLTLFEDDQGTPATVVDTTQEE